MGRLKHADHITAALLQWGGSELRDFPWRQTNDPWKVLVSEVMLQQTSVQRVVDKYNLFIDIFPTPRALANASLGEALTLWQGLGYPRRCRNLREAATVVVVEHDGVVPGDLETLLALPGIGPYTARAVLAFAYKKDVAVVDVNVARVLSRMCGEPLTARQLQEVADELVPKDLAWEWNQLLMDLGARICTARSPKCQLCPGLTWCAFVEGTNSEISTDDAAKTINDPARLSAGVSRPQPRFEGSDRQVRGRVLKLVLQGDQHVDYVVSQLGMETDRLRIERIVDALVSEGLIARNGDLLCSP